jgi:hypothetical protein
MDDADAPKQNLNGTRLQSTTFASSKKNNQRCQRKCSVKKCTQILVLHSWLLYHGERSLEDVTRILLLVEYFILPIKMKAE